MRGKKVELGATSLQLMIVRLGPGPLISSVNRNNRRTCLAAGLAKMMSKDTHQMLAAAILITMKFKEISIGFSHPTLHFHGSLPRFTLYTKMAQSNIKLGTEGKTVEMP